jgi:hypothetical protein
LSSESSKVDLSYRVGASVLASVAGSALGLLLGCVLLLLGLSESIAISVLVGAGAGTVSGFVFPIGAMDFTEATVHFLVGFFREGAASVIDEGTSVTYHGDAQTPEWLRWSLLFGALFAAALAFALQL